VREFYNETYGITEVMIIDGNTIISESYDDNEKLMARLIRMKKHSNGSLVSENMHRILPLKMKIRRLQFFPLFILDFFLDSLLIH
jgi:hypothetical protein